MSGETTIEWTHVPSYKGETWNPLRGCSPVSPGCHHCYAMGIAGRFSGRGQAFEGYARRTRGGGFAWTGEVDLLLHKLAEPLRRRVPTAYFVNSMSDLFHEGLTDEEIAAVFGVMAACPHHLFMVLTKRAERMAEWFKWLVSDGVEYRSRYEWGDYDRVRSPADACMTMGVDCLGFGLGQESHPWPLPNVWLGVSAEDQRRADERIPYLLQCPAAVRFVSAEPLLGPIMLDSLRDDEVGALFNSLAGGMKGGDVGGPSVSWVIIGGESGRGARPCDIDWIRSIVAQCAESDTACFVKQLGAQPVDPGGGTITYPRPHVQHPKGGDPSEWPSDLRVREWPI